MVALWQWIMAVKPKLVYLEWCDAISNAAWFSRERAEEWAEYHHWWIHECGWIVKETREYLVFASGYNPESEFSDEQFVNLHKIPKTWIRKRRTIKIL